MGFAKPFFGGNWKMNHGPVATQAFLESFLQLYPARSDRTVVFFPPAISLTEFRARAAGRADLAVGVQDVHWEATGAFTGAISSAHGSRGGCNLRAGWPLGTSSRLRRFG